MVSNEDVKFLIGLMFELIDFGMLDEDECERFNIIAEAVRAKV